jgi:hypothetical protein
MFTSPALQSNRTAFAKAASSTTLNPIQLENQLPGTPDWQIVKQPPVDTTNHTHDKGIEGYTSQTSVMVGSTINFAVSTVTSSFNADIYRLGWYQGIGARLMQSITNIPGKSYPVPTPQAKTGLVAAKWPAAFSLQVPSIWVSGMYIARLTNTNGEQVYVPFVVKSPVKSDLVLVHSANTDEAYNVWGGTSLYQDFTQKMPNGRAYKVSFDRPFYSSQGMGNIFYWEYPMVRWLEQNGYNVSYLSDEDVNNSQTNTLLGYKGIVIAGHSEYWSMPMRNNLQKAINSGVSLAMFGANDIYWQIRYEYSASLAPNRVIACYKDASLDPLSTKKPALTTVQFRNPLVSKPEQSLLGATYNSYFSGNGYPWVVNAASSWVFAGTNLHNGDSLPGLVGYEFDQVSTQYPAPKTIIGADGVSGVEILAASPVTDIYNQQATANTTLYTSPSGARVVNMGTFQWAWGLDGWGNLYGGQSSVVNAAAQQITANILNNFVTGSIPS